MRFTDSPCYLLRVTCYVLEQEYLMSKQILRQNTKAFYTALLAKLMKNPWNIFACPDGLICKFSDNVSGSLDNLICLKYIGSLQRLGWYLLRYDKYRELVLSNILAFIRRLYFDFYKFANF